ncbi:hypothetical protein [Clostridioides sp. ES-S-0001-03]|uniref:hypothetical protein n=1 Tax=Clostridioides sp. ES-S-0001-03 TaxID=2770771 RepID=UPI001D0C60A0|nr:hypothetical protein [Clostridioides sp. ES-S-0001-03]
METARLIAIGQIRQAKNEINRLQGSRSDSLTWWKAVKFASENILQGLLHDIDLEASTDFREFMLIQEELERYRPIDVQI